MSSAGNRKDVLALLDRAIANGAEVVKVPNGHYKVTAPDGEWVQIAFSPRSPRYLHVVKSRLRRLGLL